MKKVLSYLLVIALVLVQFLPVANAAKGTNAVADGKITITNATIGQTYEIYKLFDLESYDTEKEAYTYTISTSSPWYNFMNTGAGSAYVTLSAYETGKKIVTFNENKASDVATFARLALDYAETINVETSTQTITPNDSKEAQTTTVEFERLPLGYYLVDSSLGSLVSLNSTVREVNVRDKNTPTTIKKEVNENGVWGSTNTKKIGDTVEYKVEITAKKGAQNYVLKDKMSEGLTFNTDSVKVVETASTETGATERVLTLGQHYTVDTNAKDEYTFKVVFTKSYLDSIESDKTLVVTYSAVVNEKAVINGTGNPNKAKLEYGDKTTTEEVSTKTYVLSFGLLKTDAQGTELIGAEFKLYDALTDGNEIKVFLKDASTNTYRVAYTEAEQALATTIKAGNAKIEGLDNKTYYLEETKAPEGYNKLTSRVKVTLVSNITGGTQTSTVSGTDSTTINYANDTVTVVNTTGTLLPSTGGMGTVLFVTIGSIMALGFGVLLVTKLRISKMSI